MIPIYSLMVARGSVLEGKAISGANVSREAVTMSQTFVNRSLYISI